MKKKKIIRIVLAIVIIMLAIAIGIFTFFWKKLGLLQYENSDDNTTKSDIVIIGDNPEPILTDDDFIIDENGNKVIKQLIPESVVESLEKVATKTDVVPPTEKIDENNNVLNVLLIATDESTKRFTNNANADCMIIMSINKKRNTVKLVSLERGTAVPISIGQYAGEYEWLNNMVRQGGPGLLYRTVMECFRVDLMGYIRVNPTTFIEIVDICGGIDLSLTAEEAEYINNSIGSGTVKLGKNHLDGKTAEIYARCRAIDDDWYRIERQRTVIQSALTQANGMSVSDFNSMLDKVLPLVKTNLSKGQITELVLQVPSIAGKTAQQMSLPKAGTYKIMQNSYGKNMFATDFDKNAQILHEFLYN